MPEIIIIAGVIVVAYLTGRGRQCRHKLEYVRQTDDRALINSCACGLRQEMLVPPVADLTAYAVERVKQ